MDKKFDAESWFVDEENFDKNQKIQYEFENEITDEKNNFCKYFKIFSNPINLLLLFLLGAFSGFIAIPINLETSDLAVQIVVSVIALLVLTGLVVVRYILNKNKFNIVTNYVFDLVITIVSAITISFAFNSIGWIAYETYMDFLTILFNNKITDLVYFVIFLALMITMLKLYSRKSKKQYFVLSRIFLIFSIGGLTNAFCTFIYSLLMNIFFYDELYILSIVTSVVSWIMFTLINTMMFRKNLRRITDGK